jgi:hypothetical protein
MTSGPIEVSTTCPLCGVFVDVPVATDPDAPVFDVDAALAAHIAEAHAPQDPPGSTPLIPIS